MAVGLQTRQRSAQFYLGWFFKCYKSSEQGWQVYQTPDGRAIMLQDAFFWHALEIIARVMNLMIVEEQKRK